MKVTAYKCNKCKDLVFSRARHDFRSCSCGSISVDGGLDYCKISYQEDILPNLFYIELIPSITAKELYDDWNFINKKDKYGIIKSKGKTPKWIVSITDYIYEKKEENNKENENITPERLKEFEDWKNDHKYGERSIERFLELSVENNTNDVEMLYSFMSFLEELKKDIKGEIEEIKDWIKRLS